MSTSYYKDKKSKNEKSGPTTAKVAPMKVTDRINVVQCVRNYILKMITNVKGVKVLLLDEYTKEIISVVLGQTEIMKHEVFLLGMLSDEKRQKLPNLRCIIFVRPLEDNIRRIKQEIGVDQKYQAYSLYFSNVLPTDFMDKIASQDKKELVKHVYEYYADYIALDKSLFTLNIPSMVPLLNASWDDRNFKRVVEGILAVLLSLKKARPYIRYQRSSDLCKNIGEALNDSIDEQKDLFQIPQSEAYKTTPPVLILLDRRDDPMTPLLTQWTYQAMIHELFTIQNNRTVVGKKTEADLKNAKSNEKSDNKEVVVNAELDSFFEKHWASNWGDLCEAVKHVVDEFKDKNQVKDSINTINDIQQFMRDYPAFKRFAGEVDKHVSLVTECRKHISERKLFDLSELEQDITCSENHSDIVRRLKDLIREPKIKPEDAFRLVLLYAFRFENTKGELPVLQRMLQEKGVKNTALINTGIKLAGKNVRTDDAYLNPKQATSTSLLSGLTKLTKTVVSGFTEDAAVQNVFTQHKPRLHNVLDLLFQGRLSQEAYPFTSLTSQAIPRDVIVFIVGGATYEEALTVYKFNNHEENSSKNISPTNASTQPKKDRSVVLGGTTILNSKLFLADLAKYDDEDDMGNLM